jgi:acetyl-CoA C-acetyltransferase
MERRSAICNPQSAIPFQNQEFTMKNRKLGRGVAVVGAGMSQFGAFPEKTTRDLFVEAFKEMGASVEKGLDANDIEALYIGNYSSELFEGQGHTAPIMADWVGLTPAAGDADRRCLRQLRCGAAAGCAGGCLRRV